MGSPAKVEHTSELPATHMGGLGMCIWQTHVVPFGSHNSHSDALGSWSMRLLPSVWIMYAPARAALLGHAMGAMARRGLPRARSGLAQSARGLMPVFADGFLTSFALELPWPCHLALSLTAAMALCLLPVACGR